MATTAFQQVIDGLVAALNASPALSGVRVFDGLEIDFSFPGDAIVVGSDGSEDSEVTAGSTSQDFAELGNMHQWEDGIVNVAVWSWSGGTSMRDRRTRAFELQSAIDTAIRANANFGGVCQYARISSSSITYRQTDAGAAVLLGLAVSYRART